ncbi:MAG: hypothetical protein MK106_06740 [Mariniblastus sp.]|nr:hypothetical protein [Mariniblastus sp.]
MANFFLIDQSLEKLGGHHFDYVRCVAEACRLRGFKNTIGTNHRFQKDDGLKKFGKIRGVFRNTTYLSDSYLSGLRHLTRSGDRFLELETREDRHILNPRLSWRRWRHRARRASFVQRFADDCKTFFDSAVFTDQDHAFFTTVNEIELMGLASFLAKHPETIEANWHLQFHFNLFEGRTPEYESQQQVARIVQRCFDSALAQVPFHKLRFYTTSEALADQYNRLGAGDFEVLAYPVRPDFFCQPKEPLVVSRRARKPEPSAPEQIKRPIQFTCPGEFRREKRSSEYLQSLVNHIWDRHLATNRVQLAIQRPVRRWPAKEKIELHSPAGGAGHATDWVEYYNHPLGEEDYLDLIANTDCGLLFYDSRAYYSRRAGVLGELLSSGKPVIVPAGCWLADQLQESILSHVAAETKNNRVAHLRLPQLNWSAQNVPLPGGVLSFDQTRHPFSFCFNCDIDEPARFDGFTMKFGWHWPRSRGVYCRVQSDFLNGEGDVVQTSVQVVGHPSQGRDPAVLFQCLKPFDSVRVQLTNAFHDSMASINDLEIHCLYHGHAIAKGAVGVIAADLQEVPRAVDEMVEHFKHYRASAEAFSQSWRNMHEPGHTIDHLVASAAPLSRAA